MPRQLKTTPCIQKQLGCHVEATRAAIRSIEAAAANKKREALKAKAECDRWYRLYRKYGGTLPLMYRSQ